MHISHSECSRIQIPCRCVFGGNCNINAMHVMLKLKNIYKTDLYACNLFTTILFLCMIKIKCGFDQVSTACNLFNSFDLVHFRMLKRTILSCTALGKSTRMKGLLYDTFLFHILIIYE